MIESSNGENKTTKYEKIRMVVNIHLKSESEYRNNGKQVSCEWKHIFHGLFTILDTTDFAFFYCHFPIQNEHIIFHCAAAISHLRKWIWLIYDCRCSNSKLALLNRDMYECMYVWAGVCACVCAVQRFRTFNIPWFISNFPHQNSLFTFRNLSCKQTQSI